MKSDQTLPAQAAMMTRSTTLWWTTAATLSVILLSHQPSLAWVVTPTTRARTPTTTARTPTTTGAFQVLPSQYQHHSSQRQGQQQLTQRLSTAVRYYVSAAEQDVVVPEPTPAFPQLGDDGIYTLQNKAEHEALIKANRDKLVVLKVYAPWCRACKGLHPKFLAVRNDEKYANLPIVWAQLSIQHNKDFVKSLGVLALPTVQFYVGGSISDTFPCGPSKVPILKRKLATLVNTHVDAKTFQVKAASLAPPTAAAPSIATSDTPTSADTASQKMAQRLDMSSSSSSTTSSPPPVASPKNDTAESKPTWTTTSTSATQPLVSAEERRTFRETIPHLGRMSLADFDQVMDKARLLTFDAGSIIMREGKPGHTFYIIQQGEVEICQKTFAEDPLQYSSTGYLGTVVNRLEVGDFFGERSLLTGEPRAASIRAVETTSCYAFDRNDFPFSSPLSGRSKNEYDDPFLMENVNDKYGVNLGGLYVQEMQQQIMDANAASQIRGSVNSPKKIPGVDTDEDVLGTDEFDANEISSAPIWGSGVQQGAKGDAIFTVLRRFKMIRHVSKCVDYITLTNARWGESGSRTRRAMLVNRLSPAQRDEYAETFDLIDQDESGQISLTELKRVMDTVGDTRTNKQLLDVVSSAAAQRASSSLLDDDRPELNKQDFLGIMAEAEFYNLFRDIFKTLDPEDSGYVKAGDLDRVLSGVRDLISDDHHSVIDVAADDMDMLIDYEQFSRMLLGSSA